MQCNTKNDVPNDSQQSERTAQDHPQVSHEVNQTKEHNVVNRVCINDCMQVDLVSQFTGA